MTTQTLIDIIKNRISASKGNPTEEQLLSEVVKALEKLHKLECEESKCGSE